MALAFGFWYGFGGVSAQDVAKKPGKRIEYWVAAAEKDQLALAGNPEKPLTFRREPALRWSNPLRQTDDGTLFLWTDRGRPEVAECLFRYKGDDGRLVMVHEFQSLAATPILDRVEGRVVWTPTAGVVPVPIVDAPGPAALPVERLRQMRALAREFKAYLDGPVDRSELRSLTQPLYRFEIANARPDALDGALFGFVHTTDPEVLLLIESRAATGGATMAWHYSLARMSAYPLRAVHRGREVWRAEPMRDYDDHTKPYWARAEWAEGP